MEKTIMTAPKLKLGQEVTLTLESNGTAKNKKALITEAIRPGFVPTGKKFHGLKFAGTIRSNEKTVVVKVGSKFLWVPAKAINA